MVEVVDRSPLAWMSCVDQVYSAWFDALMVEDDLSELVPYLPLTDRNRVDLSIIAVHELPGSALTMRNAAMFDAADHYLNWGYRPEGIYKFVVKVREGFTIPLVNCDMVIDLLLDDESQQVRSPWMGTHRRNAKDHIVRRNVAEATAHAASVMIHPYGWVFNPEWRTQTVVTLANATLGGVYNCMPILADALQDAGCEDTRILTMLQNPDIKWCRGSWIIDSIRGLR